MTRDHGFNRYENHQHVMYRHVDSYSFAFDDSYINFRPQGSTDNLKANQLLFQKDCSKKKAVCIGEFRFTRNNDNYPWVITTVKKYFELIEKNDGCLYSRTTQYSYNIRLISNNDHEKIPTIRFDNEDDYGYQTRHHLHIQYEGKHHVNEEPYPAHIGNNFPHLSDIFHISHSLICSDGGPLKLFNELRNNFKNIPDEKRNNEKIWVQQMGVDLFDFIL